MAVARTKEAERNRRRPPLQRRPGDAARPGREFSKEEEFQALRQMLLIRRFEEKAGQMYGMGLIGGFCHLYIGQEAVVVGMKMAKRDGDQMITGYRDHGHMLACGMDPKGVMAELTGRRGGYSKGKGGSMHMFSPREEFLRGARHRRRSGADRDRPRLRQQVSRATMRLPDLSSATAPRTRAKSTKASTWRSCGSFRWSTSSRTTATPWARR